MILIEYQNIETCLQIVINDINGEEVVGTFYEKELQQNKSKRVWDSKINKRKSEKLYVKCEGYNNLFNSWIDKKDIA